MNIISKIRDFICSESFTNSTGVMGENLTSGSRLGGIGISNSNEYNFNFYFDVPNCELAHAGFGFGAALGGINVYWIVKQLDFLHLASDHFHNTLNLLHNSNHFNKLGKLSIICYVIDENYQGAQSSDTNIFSLFPNSFKNIALISTLEEFSIFTEETEKDFFRVIFISQRNFKKSIVHSKTFFISGISIYKFNNPNIKSIAFCFGNCIHEIFEYNKVQNKFNSILNFYALRKINITDLYEFIEQVDEIIIYNDYDINKEIYELIFKINQVLPKILIIFKPINSDFNGFSKREIYLDL